MALTMAAASLLGSGASATGNVISTILNNRAQRRLTMDMYNLQRKASLEDWDRENQYNSPTAQMERLKAAGLNPNLVYGGGAGNMQGAHINPTKPDVPTLRPVPIPDLGQAIMGYTQVKAMEAGIDQTRQQTENAATINNLNNVRILNEMQKYNAEQFTLSQRKRLAETEYEIRLKTLENLQGKAAINWDEHEYLQKTMQWRIDAAKGKVDKIAEEILLSQSTRNQNTIENRKLEQEIIKIQQGNYFDAMTMQDRISTATALKNLTEHNAGKAEQEKNIKTIEASFLKYGLKPDITQKLIELALGIASRGKGKK